VQFVRFVQSFRKPEQRLLQFSFCQSVEIDVSTRSPPLQNSSGEKQRLADRSKGSSNSGAWDRSVRGMPPTRGAPAPPTYERPYFSGIKKPWLAMCSTFGEHVRLMHALCASLQSRALTPRRHTSPHLLFPFQDQRACSFSAPHPSRVAERLDWVLAARYSRGAKKL